MFVQINGNKRKVFLENGPASLILVMANRYGIKFPSSLSARQNGSSGTSLWNYIKKRRRHPSSLSRTAKLNATLTDENLLCSSIFIFRLIVKQIINVGQNRLIAFLRFTSASQPCLRWLQWWSSCFYSNLLHERAISDVGKSLAVQLLLQWPARLCISNR